MPYVNIRLIPDEKLTVEKKQILIRKVTELLRDELGKNPATTVVTIDELAPENWGVGGISIAEQRAKK